MHIDEISLKHLHLDKVLEKYNEICKKVSKVIKRGFDNESVYKDKYLKTKIKSYKSHHKFS